MTERSAGTPDEPASDEVGTLADAESAPTEMGATDADDGDARASELDGEANETDETEEADELDDDGEPESMAAPAAAAATARRRGLSLQGVNLRPTLRRPSTAAAAPTPSEQAVHISDRASAIYVIVAIGVFVAILLNGLVLGHGGALTSLPTPSPLPSESASPSPSPSASESAAPSASASPSGSPAASASPSAAPSSAAPSVAPSGS